MSDPLVAFAAIGVLITLIIISGVPVAYGLGGLALGISFFVVGTHTLPLIGIVAYGDVMSYTLVAVPLFIFTAEVLARANISGGAFEVIARRLRKIPGSLAVATSLLSTIFGAISGSATGNVAIMTRVAMKPLRDRGYDRGIAAGLIVAGGAVGALIPPSTLMILYAVATETSVGQLMVGGLVPGLLISVLMTIYVLVYAVLRPARMGGPGSPITESARLTDSARLDGRSATTRSRRGLADLRASMPVLFLLVMMTFAIYEGFATATEIAAIGAATALLIAIFYRRLTFGMLSQSLMQTVQTSAMVMLIVVMAAFIGRMLAFMSIGPLMIAGVEALGLSPMAVVLLTVGILLVLGALLDEAAIVLVFGPLLHTMMVHLGIDPLWWSIIFLMALEIGLIAPPFGINLFVLKSIEPDIPMSTIIRGTMPFILIHIFAIILCMVFPQIITFLPGLMK